MNLTYAVAILSSLFFVSPSQAADVAVRATAYSATECKYYAGSLADVQFEFHDAALPAGSVVNVRYGLHNAWASDQPRDWVRLTEASLTNVQADLWSLTQKNVSVDSRGGPFFDQIQFVFKITAADGSVRFDNGGSSMGYYKAILPMRDCAPGPLKTLTISTVRK